MDLTEELVKYVALEVNGTTITEFNGEQIDLGKWTKLSMREAIIKFWPNNVYDSPTLEILNDPDAFTNFAMSAIGKLEKNDKAVAYPINYLVEEKYRTLYKALVETRDSILSQKLVLSVEDYSQQVRGILGRGIAAVFEAVAEEHLIQPTIIYDFPLAVSPLSKIKPDEPEWVERFEFYIGGFEVGNAFSELNDPEDQRRRFEDQMRQKAAGDDEAQPMDEDYVRALGYGLPPTAGEGIGIDRLTMVLTGSKSIRDVILFPLMRPIAKSEAASEEKPEDHH
jgi:lysyl-tRNA synthetase class 2